MDQGLKLLETVPGLREKVMEQVVRRAWEHLTLRAGESMKVECILFTNERGILGMSPGAMDMLKKDTGPGYDETGLKINENKFRKGREIWYTL